MRSDSRIRLVVPCAALWLAAALYGQASWNVFSASRFAAPGDDAGVRRAVALEPLNADYHWTLGRAALDASRLDEAKRELHRAIELNPAGANYWIDLSSAELLAGDAHAARAAAQRALVLDGTTPRTQWLAANLLLAQGDLPAALPAFRRLVVSGNEALDLDTIQLVWRATRDPDLIVRELLPATLDARGKFLRLLLARGESASAARVWSSMLALGGELPPETAVGYVEYLLSRNDVAGAVGAWDQMAASSARLKSYSHSQGLLVNGDFDLDPLNHGFDWRYTQSDVVGLALDDQTPHSGHRSLRLAFNGSAVADAGFAQTVPLAPDTTYVLSAFVRGEGMQSANGLQIAVDDARQVGTPLVATRDDLTGTFDWTEVTGEFHTGAETTLGIVHFVRSPGTTRIRGNLWIDNLRLVHK
jgi:Carbohydrate binding domain